MLSQRKRVEFGVFFLPLWWRRKQEFQEAIIHKLIAATCNGTSTGCLGIDTNFHFKQNGRFYIKQHYFWAVNTGGEADAEKHMEFLSDLNQNERRKETERAALLNTKMRRIWRRRSCQGSRWIAHFGDKRHQPFFEVIIAAKSYREKSELKGIERSTVLNTKTSQDQGQEWCFGIWPGGDNLWV